MLRAIELGLLSKHLYFQSSVFPSTSYFCIILHEKCQMMTWEPIAMTDALFYDFGFYLNHGIFAIPTTLHLHLKFI